MTKIGIIMNNNYDKYKQKTAKKAKIRIELHKKLHNFFFDMKFSNSFYMLSFYFPIQCTYKLYEIRERKLPCLVSNL